MPDARASRSCVRCLVRAWRASGAALAVPAVLSAQPGPHARGGSFARYYQCACQRDCGRSPAGPRPPALTAPAARGAVGSALFVTQDIQCFCPPVNPWPLATPAGEQAPAAAPGPAAGAPAPAPAPAGALDGSAAALGAGAPGGGGRSGGLSQARPR